MGYAGATGVPPEVGLYAALGVVLADAVLGGTPILVCATGRRGCRPVGLDHRRFPGARGFRVLTSALPIASGMLFLVTGALRLGWIVNLLSRPVLEAFLVGLSISILIGQLKRLFGIEVDGETAVAKLLDVIGQLDDVHRLSLLLGIGAVATLLVLERFVPRVPAAVVVVAVGIALVVMFGL